jgi:hypothetical protein
MQEGETVSLAVRANGTGNFTDNGSITMNTNLGVVGSLNQRPLTTAPQIADSGDGVYILLGAYKTITGFSIHDNETEIALTGFDSLVEDNWCSTSSGVVGAGAIVVSDNGTMGWDVRKLLDNTTTTLLTTNPYSNWDNNSMQDNTSHCAVTYMGGKYYLAVSEKGSVTNVTYNADNVSVWSSTDAATWTQIGVDLAMTGPLASLDIGTTGSTASDNAVWVAVNVGPINAATSSGGNVKVLHYEDIAGGSTNVWRSVATVLTGALTSPVSIATDGTSVIAVTAIISGDTNVGLYYNQ